MGKFGKQTFLVQLIHQKTKVKLEDIVDVLKALPPSIAEAFMEANSEENKTVLIGPFSMYWKMAGLGPSVKFATTDSFKRHLVKLKIEGKYPLAARMFQLMLPITKERVLARAANGGYNDDFRNPDKRGRAEGYSRKAAENKKKLKEKRKKQKELLKSTV